MGGEVLVGRIKLPKLECGQDTRINAFTLEIHTTNGQKLSIVFYPAKCRQLWQNVSHSHYAGELNVDSEGGVSSFEHTRALLQSFEVPSKYTLSLTLFPIILILGSQSKEVWLQNKVMIQQRI